MKSQTSYATGIEFPINSGYSQDGAHAPLLPRFMPLSRSIDNLHMINDRTKRLPMVSIRSPATQPQQRFVILNMSNRQNQTPTLRENLFHIPPRSQSNVPLIRVLNTRQQILPSPLAMVNSPGQGRGARSTGGIHIIQPNRRISVSMEGQSSGQPVIHLNTDGRFRIRIPSNGLIERTTPPNRSVYERSASAQPDYSELRQPVWSREAPDRMTSSLDLEDRMWMSESNNSLTPPSFSPHIYGVRTNLVPVFHTSELSINVNGKNERDPPSPAILHSPILSKEKGYDRRSNRSPVDTLEDQSGSYYISTWGSSTSLNKIKADNYVSKGNTYPTRFRRHSAVEALSPQTPFPPPGCQEIFDSNSPATSSRPSHLATLSTAMAPKSPTNFRSSLSAMELSPPQQSALLVAADSEFDYSTASTELTNVSSLEDKYDTVCDTLICNYGDTDVPTCSSLGVDDFDVDDLVSELSDSDQSEFGTYDFSTLDSDYMAWMKIKVKEVRVSVNSSKQFQDLPNDEIMRRLDIYNGNKQNLSMTFNEKTKQLSCSVRVFINLIKPVKMSLKSGHNKAALPTGFTTLLLPRGTSKLLHITDSTTTLMTIELLLKKCRIQETTRKFAIYEHFLEAENTVLVRKFDNSEMPITTILDWTTNGPEEFALILKKKRLVLQENESCDIDWRQFSSPELQTFLRILEREEREYKETITFQYVILGRAIENKLKILRREEKKKAKALAAAKS